jgi:hypothetical protein
MTSSGSAHAPDPLDGGVDDARDDDISLPLLLLLVLFHAHPPDV